jgi:hypothetical protein
MPRVGGGQCQGSAESERRFEDKAVKWPRRSEGIAAVTMRSLKCKSSKSSRC